MPPAPTPFADSLCLRCKAHRLVRGRASTFLLCTALPRKYPPQPVLRCEAFEEKKDAPDRPPPWNRTP